MPRTPTLLSRTLDIEREDLSLGEVVLEELVVGDLGVIHRTPWTSFSAYRGNREMAGSHAQEQMDSNGMHSKHLTVTLHLNYMLYSSLLLPIPLL